ncbi:9858_t:CDS:2 [Dentiscutata heterogama]|uniref:9858_t:CDS:1 n=1 Tax=Dentiscutata heterogama TaxID=1316150 RepID=A0ACA9LEN7_9GLOM|nr:9858_t:CDS:2 [Dentiscutata heterogama]
MTRTKHSETPGALKQDRHLQRNGYTDPRGMPKKEGAGQHNWGKPIDEATVLDEHYQFNDEIPQYDKDAVFNSKAADTAREFPKIKVVKPEEFKELHKSI